MISVKPSIFDNKEEKNKYSFHSLEGIVCIMKPFIFYVANDFYQEIIELNLRYLVFVGKIYS